MEEGGAALLEQGKALVEQGKALVEQTATSVGHNELTGLAAVALVALLCGLLFTRLKQPAIVGYILAGIVLGPSMLGLVKERHQVEILAELGVLLLLFVLGLELSLRAFKAVWLLAVGTALLQILFSVGLTLALHFGFGIDFGVAILLGFVLAVSSTAVAVKILDDIGELRTRIGRIVVGVLIAQDLAVVPMMLIVGGLGRSGGMPGMLTAGKILFSVAFLALLIWILSRRQRVTLPFSALVTGNVELTAVTGLAFCFGAAALSGAFGLSPAYGAFLAGLVIGNTNERTAMMQTVEPIQSVLLMVFFVSIGLLLDIDYIWANLGMVLALWFVVSIFKTILNIGILRGFGQSWPQAFIASMALAQIGEFSFILTQTGLGAGVIGQESYKLIVSVTVLSLAISPIWLAGARRLHRIALRSFTSIRFVLLLLAGRETRSMFEALGKTYQQMRLSADRFAQRRQVDTDREISTAANGDQAAGAEQSGTAPDKSAPADA